MRSRSFAALFMVVACVHVLAQDTFGVATGLHFSVDARGENIDGSRPRPTAPIAISKGVRIVNFGTLDDATDWVPQKQMYPEQQTSFVKQLDIRPRVNLKSPM
ncbi:hypothetical protein NLJ89_g8504 [Agrocybe chaxingu]|uniref:Uncharacterized protein n=1 Tax=Agrocybe chaxingu TaxID=84603 RepID=A0A9W8JUB1_9AGAR|nr:hypothetical protein NLJ89_g8504 [Agrocybe chaxingu]